MIGLIRAELLRLRRRQSLQVVVLAVPLLVGVIMVLGFNSVYEDPPFDATAYRQELIDGGFGLGLPPEQLEPLLAEAVEARRQETDRLHQQAALARASFAFPYSLAMALGSGAFVLFALILLTATTIGDEFGWATIRTVLLASSRRGQFLLVRLGALAVTSLVIFGLLAAVGTVVPLLLNIQRSTLPAELPAFDAGALLVLFVGEVIAGALVIAFAAFVTLLLRNGALTLVVALVWVAVETAILTMLFRFPSIGGTTAADGSHVPGAAAWVLEVFPLRGLTTLIQTAAKAASGLPNYPGEVVSRDLSIVAVPIISFAVVALLFAAAAFRRFQRMDIVE